MHYCYQWYITLNTACSRITEIIFYKIKFFKGNVTVKQCGTKYEIKFLKFLDDDGCETIDDSIICYCDSSLCNSNPAIKVESNWKLFGFTSILILNVLKSS